MEVLRELLGTRDLNEGILWMGYCRRGDSFRGGKLVSKPYKECSFFGISIKCELTLRTRTPAASRIAFLSGPDTGDSESALDLQSSSFMIAN